MSEQASGAMVRSGGEIHLRGRRSGSDLFLVVLELFAEGVPGRAPRLFRIAAITLSLSQPCSSVIKAKSLAAECELTVGKSGCRLSPTILFAMFPRGCPVVFPPGRS